MSWSNSIWQISTTGQALTRPLLHRITPNGFDALFNSSVSLLIISLTRRCEIAKRPNTILGTRNTNGRMLALHLSSWFHAHTTMRNYEKIHYDTRHTKYEWQNASSTSFKLIFMLTRRYKITKISITIHEIENTNCRTLLNSKYFQNQNGANANKKWNEKNVVVT